MRSKQMKKTSFLTSKLGLFLTVFTILFLTLTTFQIVGQLHQPQQTQEYAKMRRLQRHVSSPPPGCYYKVQVCNVACNQQNSNCCPTPRLTCPSGTPTLQPTGIVTPPVGSSCGTVNTGFGGDYNPSVTANPPDAETCFQQAYQQCRQAILTVINGGTDTSATHNFMLQNNQGVCRITDRVTSFTLPLGQRTNTYICATLTQQSGGLLFSSCGVEGEVFVPPPH